MTMEEFRIRLRRITDFFTVAAIADELRVSRPTVERWLLGTDGPHPAMLPPLEVYLQVKEELIKCS